MMGRLFSIFLICLAALAIYLYFTAIAANANGWSAHLRLYKAGECGEFGKAGFEYVEVKNGEIAFSAVFYPYCNAVAGDNLFANVEKSGNSIFVRLIFNDYRAAKCLCLFKVEGNVSVGKGTYNLVVLFDNRFSNEKRVLCSKTVKVGG